MHRLLTLLVVLLLALAPSAGAQPQDPEDPEEPEEPQEPEDAAPCEDVPRERQASCMQRHCREHPEDEACQRPNNGRGPPEGPQERGRQDREPGRPGPDRGRPDKGPEERDMCPAGKCGAWRDAEALRWISFEVAGDPPRLTAYTVEGTLLFETIALDADGAIELRRGPRVLEAGDGDTRLQIHDAPNGLLSFRGQDGSLTLTLPPSAQPHLGDQGGRILYGDQELFVRAPQHHLIVAENGTELILSGSASLHLVPGEAPSRAPDGRPDPPVGRERLQDAIQRGHFGAEMTLERGARPLDVPGIAGTGRPGAEILAYDDVNVTVANLPDVATPQDPLRVVVAAELESGRAFSMTLEPGLLPGVDPFALSETLEVRYFDIENGTETEASIRMADSLEDVLDPTDDVDAVAEYWIVMDPDGIQVLFMVPTWSVHAVTLASLADVVEVVTDPPVLIGAAAGVAGALAAAALMLWPRRRRAD